MEPQAGLIPHLKSAQEIRDFESLNIAEARQWASTSRLILRRFLDVASLKLLHKQMFGATWGWAGRFRETANQAEMNLLVHDTQSWLETGVYPASEVAVRFFHRLTFIRPFEDGNLRFAILATEILCRNYGLVPLHLDLADRSVLTEALKQADESNLAPLLGLAVGQG